MRPLGKRFAQEPVEVVYIHPAPGSAPAPLRRRPWREVLLERGEVVPRPVDGAGAVTLVVERHLEEAVLAATVGATVVGGVLGEGVVRRRGPPHAGRDGQVAGAVVGVVVFVGVQLRLAGERRYRRRFDLHGGWWWVW